MKVMMVGAGSVGGYFGARLVQGGVACSFLLRPKTCEAVRKRGLTVRGIHETFTVHPLVASDPRELPASDLIVLAVKRYDLDEAVAELRPVLPPGTVLLTLQNGVDTELRILELLPDATVVGGVAYIYAKIAEPGVIEHYKRGSLAIGGWKEVQTSLSFQKLKAMFQRRETTRNQRTSLKAIKALFETGGIACEIMADIRRTKWEKMCWNVVFNPLTVLLDDRVARALCYPDLRTVIRRVLDEAVAVAKADGVPLPDNMVDNVIRWSQEVRDIHTSMFDDWKAGRPTEIEHLNGYLVRRGRAIGIPTPANETLYGLIKAITEPMPVGPAVLRIDGCVLQPITLDEEALAKLPATAWVPDVGLLSPGMRGEGLRVKALLEIATPAIGADHVTFHSADGRYASSLSLKDAGETGVLVYRRDGKPLPSEDGGPFRLITPGLGDLCANVKNVSRLELCRGPGKDTRPSVPKHN